MVGKLRYYPYCLITDFDIKIIYKMKKHVINEGESMLRNYLIKKQLREFDRTYETQSDLLNYLDENPNSVTDTDLAEISRMNKVLSRNLELAEICNICVIS